MEMISLYHIKRPKKLCHSIYCLFFPSTLFQTESYIPIKSGILDFPLAKYIRKIVTTMLGQQMLHDSGNWNTRSILIHFLFLSHMKGFSLPSNWLHRIGLFKILVGIDFFSFWFRSCKLWLVPTKQYRIADNCYRAHCHS